MEPVAMSGTFSRSRCGPGRLVEKTVLSVTVCLNRRHLSFLFVRNISTTPTDRRTVGRASYKWVNCPRPGRQHRMNGR